MVLLGSVHQLLTEFSNYFYLKFPGLPKETFVSHWLVLHSIVVHSEKDGQDVFIPAGYPGAVFLVTVGVIAVGFIKWACMCSYILAAGEGRMVSMPVLTTCLLLFLELSSSLLVALGARNPTELSVVDHFSTYYLV